MSPLIITCPHCGEDLDAVQAVAEGEHREYLELLAGFGPARPVVVAYLDLFRAAPGSAMRIATRLRLVRELHRLWDGESFSYNRQVHRISRAQIGEALHDVVRAKRTGTAFVNHNYLKQVMLSKLNASERQEKRQEAKAERTREQLRQAGVRNAAPPPAQTKPEADETPVWDWPLETLTELLATHYRRPALMSGLEWMPRVFKRLEDAGVDLERLRSLAKATADGEGFEGRGAELLHRCQPGGAEPEPLAGCLPLGLAREDAGAAPASPPAHLVPPDQAQALMVEMRRYCEITRALKDAPRAVTRAELMELETRLESAGVAVRDLVAIAWKSADMDMPDAELLARSGLKIGGDDAQ